MTKQELMIIMKLIDKNLKKVEYEVGYQQYETRISGNIEELKKDIREIFEEKEGNN